MQVLLVGGSGHVGSFITPYLLRHHELRVLDLHPPRHEGVAYVAGSVTDPAALRREVSKLLKATGNLSLGGTFRWRDTIP